MLLDPVPQRLRGVLVRKQADHDELVAADAGDRVAGPHRQLQLLGRGDQQLVTQRMAVAVVDRLELVEVGQHHREHTVPASELLQPVVEAVGEQGPVRQPGQRVVQREVREVGVHQALLADVLVLADHVRRCPVGTRHRCRPDQHPDRMALFVPVALLHASAVHLARDEVGERGHALFFVVLVGDIGERHREQFLARVTKRVAEGVVDRCPRALEVQHRHADRRVGEAALPQQLGLPAPRDVLDLGQEVDRPAVAVPDE